MKTTVVIITKKTVAEEAKGGGLVMKGKNNRLRSLWTTGHSLTVRGLLLSGVLLWSAPSIAQAQDCMALGGALSGGECRLTTPQTKAGSFTLSETLRIMGAGSITIPSVPGGNSLTLTITGDLILDSGGTAIIGDAATGGSGATITANATGDIVLTNGARIRANQTKGSCASSKGGIITLSADADGDIGGDVIIAKSAHVTTNAKCSGGAIHISGVNVEVAGVVESASSLSGTGGSLQPGGGPITLDASCDLTVSGKVSSRGKDPGADLVHLEGGCMVGILGLVESTGAGHGVPNNPPTQCATRPGKPANTTACVEIVAGNALVINSAGANKGEINADTGNSGGGGGHSFIDLFSRGDILILGGTGGPFAVHANGKSNSGDEGGAITVKTVAGSVTASDRALQADSTRPGGAGGVVVVESAIGLNLDTAGLFASGDFKPAGGLGQGGTLAARAFGTNVSVQNGDVDVRPSGMITLTACTTVTTTGTDFHGVVPTVATAVCGSTPTLPTYIVLPACLCHLGIDVTKTCGCSDIGGGNFSITFSGMICNTGLTTLSGVTLVDDKVGLVPLADTTLVPTECVNYNGSFITQDNPSTDTVTTLGHTGAQTISDTASATCVCLF